MTDRDIKLLHNTNGEVLIITGEAGGDFDTLNWLTSIIKFGPPEKSPAGYPISGNDTPDKETPRWTGEPKWSYLKRSDVNTNIEQGQSRRWPGVNFNG